MCLYPKLIKNPKYLANKKNGWQPPPVKDERVRYVPIGCQKCMECRNKKTREWQVRLQQEISHNKKAHFITLTFSNEKLAKVLNEIDEYNRYNGLEQLEGYDLDNQVATWATRYFLENWRSKYKKSLRHWFVTELGHQGTENIHIHGIVWTDQPISAVKEKWTYGFVWTGKEVMDNGKPIQMNYVNEKTISYITKYVNKVDEDHIEYQSIILTSPGIGKGYTESYDAQINKYQGKETKEHYRTKSGTKLALPIYYRNKLYTENQREQLWLHKLDKQERWICGERISIKNGEEHYYRLLKFHQEKNKRLGYGDDTVNWQRKEYEKQRRNLLRTERIKNIKKEKNTVEI